MAVVNKVQKLIMLQHHASYTDTSSRDHVDHAYMKIL